MVISDAPSKTSPAKLRGNEPPVVTYIGDEEDGPAVAVVIDLAGGGQIWSGEISRDLFDAQHVETRELFQNDFGSFVVGCIKGGSPEILARATDAATAMDLALAYADSLSRSQAGATDR